MRSVKDCEEYLLNIPKFKKKTLLSDTKKFYELLGSPGKEIPKIHVAGTNGKGSTCFYTSKILKEHGIRTGLFTSPHLVSMKERFVLDGEEITDDEFVTVFEKVLDKCKFVDEEEKALMHPSFFEFLFFMFMEWMSMQKADAMVLETGLGGMLDATNIFDDPKVTAICSVGMDHMEQLGNTLEEIAFQKAGIIKENVPLVYLNNEDQVNDVIKEEADRKNAPVYMVSDENISCVSSDEKHVAFSFDYVYDKIEFVHNLSVELPTCALYQRYNSSMALVICRIFLKDRFDEDKALKALCKSSFKGRFEEIKKGIYVDGAHNPDALSRMLETLKLKDERRVLVFGACRDKDYESMLKMICGSKLFEEIVLTKIDSPRAVDPETMSECVKKYRNIRTAGSFKEAIAKALDCGCKIYIAGSLYLVGEAVYYFDMCS